MALVIEDLYVLVNETPIIFGVSLTIKGGEVHVLMGPNGSGKSTLAHTLLGHPSYTISNGRITVDDQDVTHSSPDERAKNGLFLSFQYPVEIPGVSVQNFLRTAYAASHKTEVDVMKFYQIVKERMQSLGIDESFSKRFLNDGFSGGEKKRMEMLQLAVLKPRYAILDETDSGLDVDALKIIAHTISEAKKNNTGILLITHYSRILKYIDVNHVHIMTKGKIVKNGDFALANDIENEGYLSLSS